MRKGHVTHRVWFKGKLLVIKGVPPHVKSIKRVKKVSPDYYKLVFEYFQNSAKKRLAFEGLWK